MTRYALATTCCLLIAGCSRLDDGTQCVQSHQEHMMTMIPMTIGNTTTLTPIFQDYEVCDKYVIVDQVKWDKAHKEK